MKSLRWRYSAVLGMLVVVFLFYFSSAHANALYPEPKFQYAKVYSVHQEGVLMGTRALARISGPSTEDVASFDVSGNGGSHSMKPSISSQQVGLYYGYNDPGIMQDGAYTFKIEDSLGRSATMVKNFSYNGKVPQVDSSTMLPVDQAYVGTTTPTLSFSPVAGNYLYSILVYDMDFTAIWYVVQASPATSYTIPAGILKSNTAYAWYIRVWDTAEQNCQETRRFYFYTGTKTTPEINLYNILSFPSGSNLINFPYGRGINVAPWDISYFQCTGPDNAVYYLTTRRYQFAFSAYNSNTTTFSPPASIPDGTYTFEIEDDLGWTDSKSNTYTYDPIPDFISDTRLPDDNAYSDTDQPTFSWSRVQGDTGDGSYLYSIRITDYSTAMRWYDSPSSPDTTFTPSKGLGLPKGSSYKWRVNVTDAGGNNYRSSASPMYRTITINEPSPVLDIKANGSDGPLTVSSSDQVSIVISLYPGDKAGQNADWWVGVIASFDPPLNWFTYVYPTGWQPGIKLCVQAPLGDLPSFEVLNMALPVGTYSFFLALDNPDGMFAGPWLGLDSVEVTVQ